MLVAAPLSVAEASLLGIRNGESETAAAREMAIVDVRGADGRMDAEAEARFGGRTKPRRMEQVCGSSPWKMSDIGIRRGREGSNLHRGSNIPGLERRNFLSCSSRYLRDSRSKLHFRFGICERRE